MANQQMAKARERRQTEEKETTLKIQGIRLIQPLMPLIDVKAVKSVTLMKW